MGVKAVTDNSTNAPIQSATQAPPSDSSDQPYSSIWLRNVFDLKPATPPKSDEVVKTNLPPPGVHLTGITTIFGPKRAMFMVQDAPEPGKPAKPERSVILSEGQRQDVLEVLEIHPKERTVKIKVEELVSTITFETNRPAGAAPAMANGGGPGRAPGASGGGMPGRPVRREGSGLGVPLPQGSGSRAAPQANYGQPAYGGGGFGGGYAQPTAAATTGASIPGSALFTPVTSPSTPAPSQAEPIAGDVQAVLAAAGNLAHADEIAAGVFPKVPLPEDLENLINSGQTSAAAESGTASSTVPPPLGSKVTGSIPLPP